MFTKLFVYSALVFSLISGCGGGGGSSDTPNTPSPGAPPPSTPSTPTTNDRNIISNGLSYTPTELKAAAQRIVDASFTGEKTVAKTDVESALEHYKIIIGNEPINSVDVALGNALNIELGNGTSFTAPCGYFGNMAIGTKLSTEGLGNLTVQFNQCRPDFNTSVTGQMTIAITESSNTYVNMSAYFNNVGVTVSDKKVTMNGVLENRFPLDGVTQTRTETQSMYLHIASPNQPEMLIDSTARLTGDNNYGILYSGNGRLYLQDSGYIDFSYTDFNDLSPYAGRGSLTLTGSTKAKFTQELTDNYDHVIRFDFDSNNDGTYDQGTYFGSANSLLESLPSDLVLVATEDMSIPPSPYYPNFDTYEATALTSIRVRTDWLATDPDTPYEELSFSFRWYLNDELLTEYTGATLPAGIAVFGDTVSVRTVASDGGSFVVGPPSTIEIIDSLPEIRFNNAPVTAQLGDTVQFSFSVIDPDVNDSQTIRAKLDGPEGAKLTQDGVIEWAIPESQLFPTQYYEFTLTSLETDKATGEFSHTIKVDQPNSNVQTISKLRMYRDRNMQVVADFDGDGIDELAFADVDGLVSIIKYVGGEYKVVWHTKYNYGIQSITSIHAADFDNDSSKELIVVNNEKIVVLNAFQDTNIVLQTIKFNDFERRMLVDSDLDGIPEIFYIEDDYSAGNFQTSLIKTTFASPQSTMKIGTFNERPFKLLVGNVDSDSSLELVADSGVVIDLNTMQVQWESSIKFAQDVFALVDLDNDGVEEIIGNDSSLYLYKYSAVSKTQTSLDVLNSYCDLILADVTGDTRQEMLLAPCSYDDPIVGVELTTGSLNQVWELSYSTDEFDYNQASFITVGDFDNNDVSELLLFVDDYYSNLDGFYSLPLNTGSQESLVHHSFINIENLLPIGWHSPDGLFSVPSFLITNSNYENNRQFLWFDNFGETITSPLFSAYNVNGVASSLTDINNDGISEVVTSGDGYNSGLVLRQINDSAELFSFDTVDFNTATKYRPADYDKDGETEILMLNSSNLLSLFEFGEANATTSRNLQEYTETILVDDKGQLTYIYAVHFDKISVLTLVGNSFAESSFININCKNAFLINDDMDPELEVGCVNSGSYDFSRITHYDNVEGELVLSRSVDLAHDRIVDIIADPSKTNEQDMLLLFYAKTGETEGYYDIYENSIGKISRDGKLIWRSLGLLNSNSDKEIQAKISESGDLELLFDTFSVGYWVKSK